MALIKSFEFFPEVVDSPAPGESVQHFKDWERKHIPGFYVSHHHTSLISFAKERRRTPRRHCHNSAADQRLAGATYIGNELR